MSYRQPYVGEGADGARRSAQVDREEADTLDQGDPRHAALLESAARWEEQAEAIERQRVGTPAQPPARAGSAGRITGYVVAGGLLGVLAGLLAPVVLTFVVPALFGVNPTGASVGVTALLWLLLVPGFGIAGALWGSRRAQRQPRPRGPIDTRQRPNQVIRRRDREEP